MHITLVELATYFVIWLIFLSLMLGSGGTNAIELVVAGAASAVVPGCTYLMTRLLPF